jgi:dolichol-phosphate mannosyltransferase
MLQPENLAGSAVDNQPAPGVAVVVPCYRVQAYILDVLAAIPPVVSWVFCVDDACPEGSGAFIEQHVHDPRVAVLRHQTNRGVGGAVMTGYRAALQQHADIVVKIDGDGQMDPGLIPHFIQPILAGTADYTKGNRFYHPHSVRSMPWARLCGNAVLSFMTKLSSGYWHIFDPTNCYTAIHRAVLLQLPLEQISERYFFESDMLFRLNTLRAVVVDVPMEAVYTHASSNLSIVRVFPSFVAGHLRNTLKRILYNYFLRDFHLASLEWILGVLLLSFGTVFGVIEWGLSASRGTPASAGTVMLSALPIMVGLQMLLSAFNYDMANVPQRPIHRDLRDQRGAPPGTASVRNRHDACGDAQP